MMKKLLKIIGDICLAILVLVALGILIPQVFGAKVMAVLSGSMEPNIHTGSIVYAVPARFENIQVGDPISYVLNEKGTIVTHRVVEIDNEKQTFVVKGDANDANDPQPIAYVNVIGVVRVSVPMMGYMLGFIVTTQGKIITGTAIVAVIILILILGGKKEDTNEAPAKKQKEIARKERKAAKTGQYVYIPVDPMNASPRTDMWEADVQSNEAEPQIYAQYAEPAEWPNQPQTQQQWQNTPPAQQQWQNTPPAQQQWQSTPSVQQQWQNTPPAQQQWQSAPPVQRQWQSAPETHWEAPPAPQYDAQPAAVPSRALPKEEGGNKKVYSRDQRYVPKYRDQ